MPVEMPAGKLRGMASQSATLTNELWMLVAPPSAQPVTIGRLLAALLLNWAEPVIEPGSMPYRPATIYLLGNGKMRHGRGKVFAPWAEEEIERIASILVVEHHDYIEAVDRALKKQPGTFDPLPPDFVLQDDRGNGRLGPPPPMIEVFTASSERVREGLKWHQVVSRNYQRNRYMRDLSREYLERRIEHIMANVHAIDDAGRITLDQTNPDTFFWMIRLGEVQTEIALRYGPYPAGWRKGFFDWSAMPGSLDGELLKEARPLRAPASLRDPYLVKYGQKSHMESALQGRLRVAPATAYRDPSLNAAQRDDERTSEILWNTVALGLWESYGQPQDLASTQTRVIRQALPTNFYVYCTSSVLASRLLLDFEAEAALLVRDPDEFVNRVDAAVTKQLPGWRAVATPLQYYDPLQVNPQEVEVLTWKHFRFAYQKEVRIAWLPPDRIEELPVLFLDVGSLADIAELVIP